MRRRISDEINVEVGATQVDQESSIFDMTVADSLIDDVPGVEDREERVQDSNGAETPLPPN